MRVIGGTDQFVVASAHEFEQAVEELADVGGADKVLEAKVADAAAQENPEIFVIEGVETGAAKL